MEKLTDDQKRNWINSYLADTKLDEAAVGLVNHAENRCYMNSALQSLLGVTPLVMFFSTGLYKEYMTKRLERFKTDPEQLMKMRKIMPLVNAVAQFIDGYLSEYRTSALSSPFDCKGVRDAFCDIYKIDGFVPGAQQESYDFMMKFNADMFDILCESDMCNAGGGGYKEDKSNSYSLKEELEKSKKSFRGQKSFFGHLFDFSRLETKECKKCNSQNYIIEHKLEMMPEMPVNENGVPNASSILDLFKKTFSSEEIEFKCPKCSNSESVRKNNLYSTPNYFVVPVNRLYLNNNFQKVRYDGSIDIPLEICLDDYVANNDFKDVKYEVVSITRHYGSASGGHYIAYVNKKGKWFCLNDGLAVEIKEEDMLKDAVKGQTTVIYKRKDIDCLKFFEKYGYDIVGAIQRQNEKTWKDFESWKNDLSKDPECKKIFDSKANEINDLAKEKDNKVIIQKINKLRRDIEANQKIKEQNKIRNKDQNQKALDAFVKDISAKFSDAVKEDNVKNKIEAMKQPAKLELSTEEYIQEINNTVKVEINKIVNKKVVDEFDTFKKTYDKNSELIGEIKESKAYKGENGSGGIPVPKINGNASAELKKIIEGVDKDLKVEKTDEDFNKKKGVLETFKAKDDYKEKFLKTAKTNLNLLEFKQAFLDFDTFLAQQEKNGDNLKFMIQRMKNGENYKALVNFGDSKFKIDTKNFKDKMTTFKNHLEKLKKDNKNKDSKAVIEKIESLESYKKLLTVDEKNLNADFLTSFHNDFEKILKKYGDIKKGIENVCKNAHYDELKDSNNGLKMDPEDFKNAINGLKGRINKFVNEQKLIGLKENKKYFDALSRFDSSLNSNLVKTEAEFDKYLADLKPKLDNAVENLKLVNGDLETFRKDKKYKNVINHEILKKRYDKLLSEENLGSEPDDYKNLAENYKNTLENLRSVNDDLEKFRQDEKYKNHLDKLKDQYDGLLAEEKLAVKPDDYRKFVDDYKLGLEIEYEISVVMSEERKKLNSKIIEIMPDGEQKEYLKKVTSDENKLRETLKKPGLRELFNEMEDKFMKMDKSKIEKELGLKQGELDTKSPAEILDIAIEKLKRSEELKKNI